LIGSTALIEQLNLPQVDGDAAAIRHGIISLGEQSRGVQIMSIDPDSPASDRFRQGVLSASSES
jgi:hypothetical protein